MTPARAWRLAVGRAADELFDLGLVATSVEAREAVQGDTLDLFSDDCLILLLDGPEGRRGAVSIELPILAGLIEKQTMGVVLQRSADLRPPTATDAALAAPLVNDILSGFARNLEEEEECDWAAGFRYGARLEESRLLGLSLDANDFHVFRLQLEMEAGAKQGEMIVVLPVPEPEPLPETCDDPSGDESEKSALGCRRRMGQGALMVAEAPLRAVLHRVRMPIRQLAELAPGDILPIPQSALVETRLETVGGTRVVKCTLGQLNGTRAVRITVAATASGVERALEGVGEEGGRQRHVPLPDRFPGASGADTLKDLDDIPDDGGRSAPDPSALDYDGTAIDLDAGGGVESVADLPDLPPMGDWGDLDDLPELALDDLPELK
ncbi:FliM/FliN family flagellar motor switch protein [Rhodalgimonas zhirmunskyi]|uniref:FliM/FliN family flagellar motor C-terminal domain-containing protein n=1 Tax=Rhodalgimonas zhirmunskyi TaxID=2964767 RepID=A0AAJ1U8J2_9RHOB|nr:FliM/FliN family flagellar motor C-terminal domain-containing protein [Rhodoalgimonas zhirmunskyi]MDQ2095311.1 FliM/FliN family flagellar motor C-terminal domain-containing protein [Rhodoalgimonas zhirmunskyi]